MLVIPIITDNNSLYGILNIVSNINVKTPIIAESSIFPLINLPKVSLVL